MIHDIISMACSDQTEFTLVNATDFLKSHQAADLWLIEGLKTW